jgi:Flp pilus assembly protein TadG
MQLANQLNAMEVGVILLVPVLLAVGARTKHILRRFRSHTEGAVTVEFALIISVFLLIIAGILDFGHAWYMQQVITNASREGARYGITYKTNTSGVRIAPSGLSPSIHDYLMTTYNLQDTLSSDPPPTITLGGTGLGTGDRGSALEVTVTATKTWFIISSFIPSLGDTKTLTASTIMLCE